MSLELQQEPSGSTEEHVKSIEQQAERLASDFYYLLQKKLDEYQKMYEISGANEGFPGQVESTLDEAWQEFQISQGISSPVTIAAGAGEFGNACGFLTQENHLPIYANITAYTDWEELPKKYSDRLIYPNILASIKTILSHSETIA